MCKGLKKPEIISYSLPDGSGGNTIYQKNYRTDRQYRSAMMRNYAYFFLTARYQMAAPIIATAHKTMANAYFT